MSFICHSSSFPSKFLVLIVLGLIAIAITHLIHSYGDHIKISGLHSLPVLFDFLWLASKLNFVLVALCGLLSSVLQLFLVTVRRTTCSSYRSQIIIASVVWNYKSETCFKIGSGISFRSRHHHHKWEREGDPMPVSEPIHYSTTCRRIPVVTV